MAEDTQQLIIKQLKASRDINHFISDDSQLHGGQLHDGHQKLLNASSLLIDLALQECERLA